MWRASVTAEVFPEVLRRAIESSDAFVFVISPDAVRSSFCVEEVEHAAKLNKRIVPLALRPVEDAALPEEVRFRNWIPADGDGEFEGMVNRVVTALDTDLEWERQHSRLTVKALEWDQSDRDRSFLLRGADLRPRKAGWRPAPARIPGRPCSKASTWSPRAVPRHGGSAAWLYSAGSWPPSRWGC